MHTITFYLRKLFKNLIKIYLDAIGQEYMVMTMKLLDIKIRKNNN